MEKRIAPSEQKAQALHALLEGQMEGQNGEELLSLSAAVHRARLGPAGACAQKVTVLNSGERDPQNAFRLYAAFSLVFEGLSTTVRKTSVFLAATKRAISGSKRCQKTRLEINVRKTRGIASF